MLRPAVILCLLQGILCLTSDKQLSSSNVTTEIVECFIEAVDTPWEFSFDESSRALHFNYITHGLCELKFWRIFECYHPLVKSLVLKGQLESEAGQYEIKYYGSEHLEDHEIANDLQKQAGQVIEELILQIQKVKTEAAARNETRILADDCSSIFFNMGRLTKLREEAENKYHDLSVKLDILRARHNTLWYYLPPFIIFVVTCGLVGNGLLLVIFVRHPDTRTGPNTMLVNLAISDTLFLFGNVVLDYCVMLWGFPLDSSACYVFTFMLTLVTGGSVYTMTILSFSRLMAVTTKPGDRSHKLLNSMPVLVATVWVLSSLVSIPDTLNSTRNVAQYSKKAVCVADIRTLNGITDFLFLSFLPLIAITCFYIAASRRLRESARNIPGEALGQAKVKLARERGAKILPALAIVFAVTYLPFYTFWLIIILFQINTDVSLTFHRLYFAVYFLFNLNSTLNPVALYLASGMFRKYFNNYLFLKFLKKKAPPENLHKL